MSIETKCESRDLEAEITALRERIEMIEGALRSHGIKARHNFGEDYVMLLTSLRCRP